ncbi:MAG: DUF1722 domain-containing protein [Chitinivibrionales bacterium]|nr:DUF1722 domain-containing protein [Chitinivibrionales bacterium]
MKIGISRCLLGDNVRYDGAHKLDRYLRDILGKFVEWVPVCPEVECGLSIPREAIRLVGTPEHYRLVTLKTQKDITVQMTEWAAIRLEQLAREDLCGYIFKTKSPSCGMRGVKVYTEKGMPSYRGSGIFARLFMERFLEIPVEDEGRLHDDNIRENFIERIFVFSRWKDFLYTNHTVGGLIAFHTNHKLLFMAHSPRHLRSLGRIVVEATKQHLEKSTDKYFHTMMEALKLIATVKKNVNVLMHCMGYFKKQLTPDEKKELAEVIEQYHSNLIPLIVPVTLIKHYARKYNESYLKRQYYLNPHPAELKLRNHV